MKDKNFKEFEEQVRSNMNVRGIDLHTKTASALFGVDCQDVTEEQREKAKAFNYGRLYSMDAESVLSLLKMEDK